MKFYFLLTSLFLCSCSEPAIEKKDSNKVYNQPKKSAESRYVDHIAKLQKKVPEGFHMQIEKPFVVIGNESKNTVSHRSRKTVRWTVEKLKESFFSKDPNEIVDIWLFKDSETYRKYALKLFRDRPTTPFGYYSPRHESILMNISTGSGTLVHEIVHPFMASNFPECPSWFNEGLASLYEQCTERYGRIYGLPNWRLKGLKTAINNGSLMTFENLCSTTDAEFYSQRADKYAQARYLCYYLQEKKLLRKYYKEFTTNVKDDPTGFKSLKKVLETDDMIAFQKMWEKWCLEIEYN